jgi:hypothetical protein
MISCVHNSTCYDPLVLVHARALLTSTPEGRTAYLDADLREPEKILNDPVLRETVDLTQPVGLVLVSILPFVAGDDVAGPIVRTLLDAVPSGSYLVLSHATFDTLDPEVAAHTGRCSGPAGPTSGRAPRPSSETCSPASSRSSRASCRYTGGGPGRMRRHGPTRRSTTGARSAASLSRSRPGRC